MKKKSKNSGFLCCARTNHGSAIAANALPLFVLAQHRNPEFFDFFFIREHFGRYLLPDHHRPGPWWYFVPVLLVGLMPWTPSIPAAFARAGRASAPAGLQLDRFLAILICVML